MTTYSFNLNVVDHSWLPPVQEGLSKVDPHYLQQLATSNDWLPGHQQIFNAFSLPISNVKYVLFGESPYPRKESANGYAFWDAAVKELWSPVGLSKQVNRATSLRNIIKMLLIAEGALDLNDYSQAAIAALDKKPYVQTNQAFFSNFINHGFLLLNATPVLQTTAPLKDAIAWHPFMQTILNHLVKKKPDVEFILLGKIANTIDSLLPKVPLNKLYAEHPYNLSFITNSKILDFFQPFHLLLRN